MIGRDEGGMDSTIVVRTLSTIVVRTLSTHPRCANTEHHHSANTKHHRSANTEYHRSANTEHHSNANNLELGSVPPVDVQVADEIGQKVKTPVATTCNLYDRVSLLPSEEDVEDEDDDSAADVHLVVHNSGNPHDADKGDLGDPLLTPVNNFAGLTLPFHIQTPGSPLEEEWAKLITQTWDRKYVYQQMKPIWDNTPPQRICLIVCKQKVQQQKLANLAKIKVVL